MHLPRRPAGSAYPAYAAAAPDKPPSASSTTMSIAPSKYRTAPSWRYATPECADNRDGAPVSSIETARPAPPPAAIRAKSPPISARSQSLLRYTTTTSGCAHYPWPTPTTPPRRRQIPRAASPLPAAKPIAGAGSASRPPPQNPAAKTPPHKPGSPDIAAPPATAAPPSPASPRPNGSGAPPAVSIPAHRQPAAAFPQATAT